MSRGGVAAWKAERIRAAIDELADDGELEDDAICFDDLDGAIIGIGGQYTGATLVVYAEDLLIREIRRVYRMSEDDAWDWYNHNVRCLWAGPGTPIIVQRVKPDRRPAR